MSLVSAARNQIERCHAYEDRPGRPRDGAAVIRGERQKIERLLEQRAAKLAEIEDLDDRLAEAVDSAATYLDRWANIGEPIVGTGRFEVDENR